MKKNRLLLALFSLLLLSLTSCTKTGPQGLAGANGTNGTNGDANVFTDTLSVESTEWALGAIWAVEDGPNASSGYGTKYYDVPFDKITSGIIDSGMVSVYIAPYSGGQWLQLPYTFETNFDLNFVYTVTPGNVRLQIFLVQVPGYPVTLIENYLPANYHFKIVAVAGNL